MDDDDFPASLPASLCPFDALIEADRAAHVVPRWAVAAALAVGAVPAPSGETRALRAGMVGALLDFARRPSRPTRH